MFIIKDMEKIIDFAIFYAKKGWYVFPCREKEGFPYKDRNGKEKIPSTKSPYISGGLKASTIDINIIKSWWTKWPNACIGISCEQSNLFVIDIDVKNGKNGINNFMQLGIYDGDALHSRTPSMGIHVIFKGQGKTTTNPYSGIDTRGKGGYFIAPPSFIIKNGETRKYVSLDDWSKEPGNITDNILDKLGCNKQPKQKRYPTLKLQNVSQSEQILKAKSALNKLPIWMCDSYQNWIEIGMSLYKLGQDGLDLWIEWSKKSQKYSDGECENKWETFSPSEITIGSLFYYSNKEGDIGK